MGKEAGTTKRRAPNRDRLIEQGLRVVHERGYANASVRDIVQAAGVPQGSFTNHFVSKEAFALEIIDRYFVIGRMLVDATLLNDALPPLDRLRQYFDGYIERLRGNLKKGCLYGNFTIECNEAGEAIRKKLQEIFADTRQSLAYCLRAAVAKGELKSSLDCDEIAGFIVSSTQGAVLLSKVCRSAKPLERFTRTLFESVLV